MRVDGRAPGGLVVSVAPMRPRHVPAVVAIERRVYPRPWSERLFAEELERRGRAYLVARVGAEVVGYAGVLMIADDGHVATVSVDPDWQGLGIASRLLVELVRRAVDLGAAQLTLEVRMSNERAQRLYQRFGFVPAGARKAYYGDNGEDALVMWAHDVATPAYAERLATIEAGFASPTVRAGAADERERPAAAAPAAVHPALDHGRMARP